MWPPGGSRGPLASLARRRTWASSVAIMVVQLALRTDLRRADINHRVLRLAFIRPTERPSERPILELGALLSSASYTARLSALSDNNARHENH